MTRSFCLALVLAACGPGDDTDTSANDSDSDTDADSDSDTDSDTDAATCARWTADRANLSEGTWSGSTSTCDAGTLSADAHANTLRLVNLYRSLAGLPAVTEDAGKSGLAQACALIMQANGSLNHYPSSDSACYTADGAAGAGSSNIASGPSVMAVDMYVADWGNETTLGHRRWILSNSLGPIGIGGTSGFSCLQVIGGSGNAGAAWTAFPKGRMPIAAWTASYVGLDSTGWTVQSDSIDLNSATVTVTRDGTTPLDVNVVALSGGYGSSYAINILPQGWVTEVGHTYHVELAGTSTAISYDVDPIGCN